MPGSAPALLAAVCLAFACGKGTPAGQCQHNFDCAAGQACVSGKCQAAPCGGCQPDEACGSDGNCVPAQGATCADHTCPTAYPCNSGGVCAKPCTLDSDCDVGLKCNSALKSCTQCVFDTDCSGIKATPVCDTDTGSCAQCNVNFDCVKALGTGHFCDGHACKAGCKTSDDCNATLGETCDTSTTPGKCVQCHTNSDCAAQGPSAGACDDTGHCVQCWGATQTAANFFCSTGTPECNLALKQCVQCLPANNQCGGAAGVTDCGYPLGGVDGSAWGCSTTGVDPHDAKTCNGDTYSCVDGCQYDTQCGCPRTAPGQTESNCARFPDQEHCDPNKTTMAGVTGATRGACVQCADNTHCEYKIIGTAQYGGAYATLDGARCVNDSCVEGCDSDADCYPDHAVPAANQPKYCDLTAGDANFHKCVQCHCDSAHLSPDQTYCEGDPICGSGKVCDVQTLTCRKRRFGEMCLNTTDCGDPNDPLIANGCTPTGLCVYNSDPYPTGTEQYCAPDKASFGRCGVTCDSPSTNKYCGATVACPAGSQCRTARDGTSHGTDCVPAACSY